MMTPEPSAPIVKEDCFLLWSLWAEAPFMVLLLWAMVGALRAGTAGDIKFLPFTGEIELDFACCGPNGTPIDACGVLEAIGALSGLIVVAALAYDRADGCNGCEGVAPMPVVAAEAVRTALVTGLGADDTVLVIRCLRSERDGGVSKGFDGMCVVKNGTLGRSMTRVDRFYLSLSLSFLGMSNPQEGLGDGSLGGGKKVEKANKGL